MSITDTRTIGSIVGGETRTDGGRIESRNPANLGDLVCEAALGDAETFVGRLPQRARGAARLGRRARARYAARRSSRSAASWRRTRRRWPAWSRARSASPIRSRCGEVQEIVDTCDFFLGEGRRLYGQTVPCEMPDKQLFTFRNPVGVAAIITAGNFPVAVPSWYLVPALLCGNAVVWKPAEYAPALGDALASAVHQGRAARRRAQPRPVRRPDRVRGPGARARRGPGGQGRLHRLVGGGLEIGELCGRHLQSPCLELGGKNPLVVMPDADLDLAVEGALFSGFGTAGQRCTSLGTVIVHESIHDEFLRRFTARRRGRGGRRPDRGRALRADDRRALRRALRGLARADPRPPHGVGLDRHRADHERQPARRLRGRPGRRHLLPPDDRRRRDGRGRHLLHRDLRPDRGRRALRRLRRGDRAGQRPRLRAVGGDLHHRPESASASASA